MTNNDQIAQELKKMLSKQYRGIKDVVVSQAGIITVFCKSQKVASNIVIDLVRIGRRNATVTEPGPFTMGCYFVQG